MSLPPETKATLLLCGSFEGGPYKRRAEPLTLREFNELLRVLRRLSIPLAEFITDDGQRQFRADLEGSALFDGRIGLLLDRRDKMATAVVNWGRRGIWVIDRTHPEYPARYRQLLNERAPPLLFGGGDISLLNEDSQRIAVVGSRDIDRETAGFAWSVGHRAAESGATVVSGGARGVDRTVVDGAIEMGGRAIVVLPGELDRVLTLRRFRRSIDENRMVLMSPYQPEQAFTGENALGRNRLIYCLADAGIVVESSLKSGGTWAGATDVLKHGWVPVYVRQTDQPSPGNEELVRLGAHPISQDVVDDPAWFADWLRSSIHRARSCSDADSQSRQLGLFTED